MGNVQALLRALQRLAILKWLGTAFCALAMLCANAASASALEGVQAKTRVWGFELAEHHSVGLSGSASPRLNRENQSGLAEVASGSPHAARGLPLGSFSVREWASYPSWAPKPTGPFRLLSGADYDAARKTANAANAALRRADPAKYAGKQIHEIHPVKFGGSPTDPANKIALTPTEHSQLTNFWNQLMRDLQ